MKKAQLFLLHYAGGNGYSFQFMRSHLKDFEVIPLELPGRGKRMRETLLVDFDAAALDLYQQLVMKLTGNDFLIYGHSMGAYLALRITNMLEKANYFPQSIIVSGNPGPGVCENKKRYLLQKDEFLKELGALGGVSPELLSNDELLEIITPILRADFQIAEENGLDNEPAIQAPVFAIMGDQEEYIDQISNWKKFTRSEFDFTIMTGGHFFIFDHGSDVARMIWRNYNKLPSPHKQNRNAEV